MNKKEQFRRIGRYLWVFMLLYATTGIAHAQTITFKGGSVPLTTVFKAVFEQTGYSVAGARSLIESTAPVKVDAKEMPLKDFLEHVLKSHGLQVRIEGKTIILYERATEVAPSRSKSASRDSLVVIGGRVLNPEGQPMAGVSIRTHLPSSTPVQTSGNNSLKDMPREWVTDQQGRFNILCYQGEKLAVSFLGHTTVEIDVGRQSNQKIEITLIPQEQELEAMVVTGIFTRKSESFTGAAQTFTKEQLFQVGNSNVLQSLKNLDPSFNIVQNLAIGSDPNALPTIQLRGQSGFPDLRGEYQTDPNQPLFILDGFESSLSRIMDLDMNRIRSVTILKDAAAKAIYGSKAANGVVVIETERPKEGKVRLSYTGSLNVSTPDLSSYNLTDAAQKLQVEKDAGLYQATGNPNANNQYLYDADYNRILEEVLRGVNTDWLSKPVRTGIGQRHTLRAEGGTESLQYGVDFSYNNVAGTMKGSDRNTTSGGVTLSYRVKKFSVQNDLSIVYNKGINSPYGSFADYASMNPYFRTTDDNGNVTKIAGESIVTGIVANPLWNTTINTKNYDQYTQILNNFYAEWFISNTWKLTGRASILRQENGSEVFYPASHTAFLNYTSEELINRRGLYGHGDGYNTQVNADFITSYSKNIGKHSLFANTNWSISNAITRSLTITAEGFPNDYMDDITFARQYQENSRPSGVENTVRDLGALAAVNYSYGDRYLMDGSFRMSGSSQFGSDNRWGKFWSTGLGWNIHNEAFAQNWNFLDQLRIRGSIGYTGSQNFSSYQSRTTFTYNTTDTYLGYYGAYLMSLGNSNLKWQRKFDQNIGFDLNVLNRRLTLRADYYVSSTDDLLTDVTIPSSTGFTSYKENLGKVENKGYEISVNYRLWNNLSRNNFFNIYANATQNRNRIRQISNSLTAYNEEQTQEVNNRPVVRYAEGQSMTAIWAVPSYGVDPATGRDIFIAKDGTVTNIWDAANLAVVGDAQPTLRGNAGFNLMYNKWSLNVGLNWQFGGQLYNQTLVNKVENANLAQNVDQRIFTDRWRTPGDVTWFKNIQDRSLTRATQRFVQDQNEWNLSTINLSYDLDKLSFVQRNRISRLRLSLNMNDVATVSSIRIERGTAYPFARTFSFSVQAIF